jgi:outer membrane protein OmpA-like peptidoglycan-associated protein
VKIKLLFAVTLALSLSAGAQTNSQTTMAVEPMDHTPTFRVTVVSRSVQAVNYKHRSGASKLDFAGTDLMPAATGQAKVESKKGYIAIEVEFANLQKPTTFGSEYLTYILWAISPEGRAVNLGEVLIGDNHRSKLDVTTDLQAFALVVTAEPYYAVRQPSNVVVLENVVRSDTKGTTEAVHAKYELLERGGYIPTGYKFDPVVLNTKLPLEFFEARNALRIAQSEGAETYARDSYQHAVRLMNNADEYATRKRDTARGLIVSMSDVLFDTGKYSLKPGAREKLAKVAGILMSYPGLNIEVGGYTDNVGGDGMNQRLSENRASSVRDYLVQQGVATNSVSARGFGNTLPVATNDNSAGRQQNRRVELLVSGEAIGNPANTTTGRLQ